jgi:mannose-6-phosphate isomerase-like protein (cupin superfamily)
MFAVDRGAGRTLPEEVARLLDPVDPGSLHYWSLDRARSTELHFHEHDEHWLWSRGRTMLTIRLPDGRSESFEIGPGWIVYCVRGVEHGHEPLEDWACFESTSVLREGARTGHRHREP